MRYGSVCSGIEAATAAWHPRGWVPAFYSEIEPFPRAVLEHHYPSAPLHGDFTTIKAQQYGSIDLLVGGTPCQSFSIAGLRKGMADERGNLALEYLRLAQRERPQWLVWENVPGVLSSNGGRDFGAFLGGLVELGYGFAYRVLDAQYFGVPQRRRRVFVVGYSGDWRPAAAVLFERHSLQGYPAPSRKKGETAPTIPSRSTGGGGLGTDFDLDGGLRVTHTLRASFDGSEDGTGRGTPLVLQPYSVANCLTAGMAKGINSRVDEGQTPIVCHGTQDPIVSDIAHQLGRNNGGENVGVFPILEAGGGKPGQGQPTNTYSRRVRRLTPVECERLQGFPDNYTRIPYRNKLADKCPDGPRYKALGNSMAVPVMCWIGERIDMVVNEMSV